MGLIKAIRPRQKAMLGRKHLIAQTERAAGLPSDPAADTPRQSWIRARISKQAALDIVNLRRWREVTGGGVYYNRKVDNAIANTLPTDFDIRPTLRAHPVPITIIDGDHDYIDPGARAWKSLAASVAVVFDVLPHAGHYAWIDDPTRFAAALRAGLRRADATR